MRCHIRYGRPVLRFSFFGDACPAADLNAPTLVLLNGKILTMNDQSQVVQAVAIRDGKILAAGDNGKVVFQR